MRADFISAVKDGEACIAVNLHHPNIPPAHLSLRDALDMWERLGMAVVDAQRRKAATIRSIGRAA